MLKYESGKRGVIMAVNEKLRDHLHDQLFQAILELQSIDECYEFFEDLCTMRISSKRPGPVRPPSAVSSDA